MNYENNKIEVGKAAFKRIYNEVISIADKYLRKYLLILVNFFKTKPLASLMISAPLLLIFFWSFSAPRIIETESISEESLNERPVMSGVAEAVDPRAAWTAKLEKTIQNMEENLKTLIEAKTTENKNEINDIANRIGLIEEEYVNSSIEREEGNKGESGIRVKGKAEEIHQLPVGPPPPPPRRLLKHIQRVGVNLKKDIQDYITAGAFARAVLLSGVVVETGTGSSVAPKPIILRLVDKGIFSKQLYTEQVKEAILIGFCEGRISSERAECKIETLSLRNKHGEIIEKHQVQGWIFGEDGREGIKGRVVDRSSDVARMAMFNGILGGMAQFFQNQATNGVFPISPITGQQNALKTSAALKGGMYAGVGNALEKLADFSIRRAEQMNPVIEIDSGRTVEVVFRKGVSLTQDGDNKVESLLYPNDADYTKHVSNNEITATYENNSSQNAISSFDNQKSVSALQERFIPTEESYQYDNSPQTPNEQGF